MELQRTYKADQLHIAPPSGKIHSSKGSSNIYLRECDRPPLLYLHHCYVKSIGAGTKSLQFSTFSIMHYSEGKSCCYFWEAALERSFCIGRQALQWHGHRDFWYPLLVSPQQSSSPATEPCIGHSSQQSLQLLSYSGLCSLRSSATLFKTSNQHSPWPGLVRA